MKKMILATRFNCLVIASKISFDPTSVSPFNPEGERGSEARWPVLECWGQVASRRFAKRFYHNKKLEEKGCQVYSYDRPFLFYVPAILGAKLINHVLFKEDAFWESVCSIIALHTWLVEGILFWSLASTWYYRDIILNIIDSIKWTQIQNAFFEINYLLVAWSHVELLNTFLVVGGLSVIVSSVKGHSLLGFFDQTTHSTILYWLLLASQFGCRMGLGFTSSVWSRYATFDFRWSHYPF